MEINFGCGGQDKSKFGVVESVGGGTDAEGDGRHIPSITRVSVLDISFLAERVSQPVCGIFAILRRAAR